MTDTGSTSERLARLSPEGREQLMHLLKERGRAESRSIQPRPPSSAMPPCSFAQQRLWFLEQLDPGNPSYSIGSAVIVRGVVDEDALGHSLNAVVQRQEALRTSIVTANGEPVQLVASRLQVPLPVVDLCDRPAMERLPEAMRLGQDDARRPFDLTNASLMRAMLLRLGDEEHVLCLTMHHIVTDGWSLRVFFGELMALYEARLALRPSPLAALPVQYADFALWQRERLRGAVLEEHLAYWRRRLATLPELDLPTDRPRPADRTYEGSSVDTALDAELTDRLRSLARQERTTLFMVLLAAFQALLGRYSGQIDFAVGTPVAGRDRPELEGIIGFFVNTLALRADLAGNPSFRELLGRVRTTTLDAYAHQELPFEKLVEELQPERRTDQNPLVQVMFSLQQTAGGYRQTTGLHLEPL
ncbi:MAG TPA: condensation domain-containing protein, partial [Chloroflexota bacterium]|nr:condensation domain-containing protein [Chloroflexota bacterium]